MAADKKARKERKAEKKTRKAERKAARKAEKKGQKKAAREARLAKKAGRADAKAASAARGTKRATGKRPLRDRRQPETLRLRSASPSFTVGDLQKSLAFYRDLLGFTEKERWERDGELRGMELVAGGVSVFLAQDDWQKGHDRVKGLGFRIYCETTQDLDGIARRIQERGGALAEEPKDQPWGGRDFAVVDPDGFKITIATAS